MQARTHLVAARRAECMRAGLEPSSEPLALAEEDRSPLR
jgi:hypothetical protein